ncbi:MAG: SpoIIE family protein phosphatase [Lachnospiraceae bacterium]|nr:SpoIIE family protein phosphatase [Lachnospiraceae bacterium]
MTENKKVRRAGLTVKIIALFFIVGLLIYVGAIVVGYMQYDHSIKEYYDQMAYDASEIAAGYFEDGELARYARAAYEYNYGRVTEEETQAIMAEPRYQEMISDLHKLRASVEANDVFVVVLDVDVMKNFTEEAYAEKKWKPIYYIADSYTIPEENYPLGGKGGIELMFKDAVLESYLSGERYQGFYISESKFGYNMTAMYPVVEDGSSVAFVGVEIPMKTLQTNIAKFVTRVSLITLLIVILSLITVIAFSYKYVISPIKLVSSEANHFIENQTEISEKLRTIRTRDEIQTLSESIYQMEVGINEYIDNLQRVTAEKERIGAELSVATQIQADMLPSIFPPFPDRHEFDIFATMDPAKEVGGDFYDFFLVDDDHLALVMADVSGKGVPAALFMVIAKTLIKNRTQMGGTPGDILADVNDQLCEGNKAELFVTVWLAIIEISTGRGIAANAGHEHPAIRRAGGDWELEIYKHSPAVATMEGLPFREHEFELHPGDRLYVYTDGVCEATDSENVLYGPDRMLAALNREPEAEPSKLLENVKKDIDIFVGEAPQFDDITMLGLIWYGTEGNA